MSGIACATERLDRIRSAMSEVGVDVLALAPSDNLRYAVGFSPLPDERACIFFVSDDGLAFVVPSLNAEQTKDATGDIPFFVWGDEAGPIGAIRAALSSLNVDGTTQLAVDPEMRSDVLLAVQELLPAARCVDGARVISPLREVKSDEEIDLLRASAGTADAAMERALEACRVGATELQIAEAAVAGFRDAGVEDVAFAIVASGSNGAFPHHHPSSRALAEGEAVVIDLGGRLHGYCSDITRMACVGDPWARYLEVHEAVEAAVTAASAAAGPGVMCDEVDAAARSVIEEAGYGRYFVHRTGHGLGLSVHEPPWIVKGSKEVLRQGMVFSIEPGIYLPGEFGVRLEEIVHITEEGCERFSDLSRDVHLV
jgi:Xaa-Pro aminopeptidase